MHLVDSLLAAIVREDGESLVLHVGERPIVVSPRGPSEIASAAMTLESMDALLAEVLTSGAQDALAEFGAVEAELAPSAAAVDECFTVVAARGGDDIWIEIRRRRTASHGAAPALNPSPTLVPNPPAAPEPTVVLPMARSPVTRSDGSSRTAPGYTGWRASGQGRMRSPLHCRASGPSSVKA